MKNCDLNNDTLMAPCPEPTSKEYYVDTAAANTGICVEMDPCISQQTTRDGCDIKCKVKEASASTLDEFQKKFFGVYNTQRQRTADSISDNICKHKTNDTKPCVIPTSGLKEGTGEASITNVVKDPASIVDDVDDNWSKFVDELSESTFSMDIDAAIDFKPSDGRKSVLNKVLEINLNEDDDNRSQISGLEDSLDSLYDKCPQRQSENNFCFRRRRFMTSGMHPAAREAPGQPVRLDSLRNLRSEPEEKRRQSDPTHMILRMESIRSLLSDLSESDHVPAKQAWRTDSLLASCEIDEKSAPKQPIDMESKELILYNLLSDDTMSNLSEKAEAPEMPIRKHSGSDDVHLDLPKRQQSCDSLPKEDKHGLPLGVLLRDSYLYHNREVPTQYLSKKSLEIKPKSSASPKESLPPLVTSQKMSAYTALPKKPLPPLVYSNKPCLAQQSRNQPAAESVPCPNGGGEKMPCNLGTLPTLKPNYGKSDAMGDRVPDFSKLGPPLRKPTRQITDDANKQAPSCMTLGPLQQTGASEVRAGNFSKSPSSTRKPSCEISADAKKVPDFSKLKPPPKKPSRQISDDVEQKQPNFRNMGPAPRKPTRQISTDAEEEATNFCEPGPAPRKPARQNSIDDQDAAVPELAKTEQKPTPKMATDAGNKESVFSHIMPLKKPMRQMSADADEKRAMSASPQSKSTRPLPSAAIEAVFSLHQMTEDSQEAQPQQSSFVAEARKSSFCETIPEETDEKLQLRSKNASNPELSQPTNSGSANFCWKVEIGNNGLTKSCGNKCTATPIGCEVGNRRDAMQKSESDKFSGGKVENRRDAMKKSKSVQFGSVDTRLYERVLGANPPQSLGPSLSIGWKYETLQPTKIEETEPIPSSSRSSRSSSSIYLSKKMRIRIAEDLGYSRDEIRTNESYVKEINFHRQQTIGKPRDDSWLEGSVEEAPRAA